MKVIQAVITGFALAASASGPAMARDLHLSAPNSAGGAPTYLAADEYAIDDGTFDIESGLSGNPLIWLNQFNVVAGLETITAVRIAWAGPGGIPGEALIFNDPNGDGNPTDITPADLLASVPIVSEPGPTNVFSTYPVPNVVVGNAGDSFFVGVCINASGTEPALLLDTTDPDHDRGWFQSGVVDCSNPNGLAPLVPWHLVFPGVRGDFMLRANAMGTVAVETVSWWRIKATYK